MASNIQLTNGKSLTVSESVADVQDAITSLESVTTPMVRLTEFGPVGQAVLVFIAHITSIKDLG